MSRILSNLGISNKFNIGPIVWIFSGQYFISQLIVLSAWAKPYSLSHNTISDLGNTACGMYGSKYICSPLHWLMNWSFIVLGLSMIVGSILICQRYSIDKRGRIGIILFILGGLGTITVGLAPENTISLIHILGATMPFFFGNIAIIILGISLPLHHKLRIFSIIAGILALVALGLFLSHEYLGIGIGGMERLVSYPQTVWMIVIGVYLLMQPVIKVDQTL